MSTQGTVLVIGSSGQLGAELVAGLRQIYGRENVIASDIKDMDKEQIKEFAPYETLNVLNAKRLFEIVRKYDVKQIYLLAALLSATAEKSPMFAWDLNMNGLFNVLDLAKEKHIDKVYWPSSIAVFGPTTPRINTPQFTIMEPNTVYGISKQTGERWCEYYFNKYGVDVRSLRYPGLIGWKTAPGGGTTDYAVHIYHEAIKNNSYECFLSENTTLPMMFMDDAIKATLDLMHSNPDNIKVRSSYNLAGMSFSPKEIASEIKNYFPEFQITYNPDSRQAIADSWPQSIDDSVARKEWGWKPSFDLKKMSEEMIVNLKNEIVK
ncbi:MAG: NAD-dependent epimerase/dehydratase family protein [Bacteroidota bacterium]|jgi:nucleoside-diphosphate-sugar epimerase